MSDAGSRPSSQPSSPVPDSDSESQGSDGASRASSREIDYEWWTWFGDEGDAERPSRYLNAREYPMALNSIIGPSEEYQYKIVAKLGFGGFSTVWMGWGKGEKNKGQWSAIKIFRANEGDVAAEIEAIKRVRDCGVDVVELNSEPFKIPGPRLFEYNTYLCLPMKLSGPPIYTIATRRLSFDERLEIAISAVEIMEKMQSRGHIMADFSSKNLLLTLEDEAHTYSRTRMRRIIGHSEPEEIGVTDYRRPGKKVEFPYPVPRKLYASVGIYRLIGFPLKLQVTDVHQDPSEPNMVTAYASPEFLETKEVTTESSIWSLGVLLCEIWTGYLPFERHRGLKEFLEGTPDEQMRKLREFTEMPLDADSNRLFPDYETDPVVELLQQIFTKRLDLAQIKKCLLSWRKPEDHLSDIVEEEEKIEPSSQNYWAVLDTENSETPI